MFHQCSVHVNLATEIVRLVYQSEASVIQSEHHLHNLRFVSAAGRLAGGQWLDERPGTGHHCQLWDRRFLHSRQPCYQDPPCTPSHSCNPPFTTQAGIQ